MAENMTINICAFHDPSVKYLLVENLFIYDL